MMEKQFVPYELALKLKEIGFNEECLRHYENDDEALYESFGLGYLKNSDLTEYETSAPLWQQAFDWFRINKKLTTVVFEVEGGKWDWNIQDANMEEDEEYFDIPLSDTYEEAKLKCLIKLIELT